MSNLYILLLAAGLSNNAFSNQMFGYPGAAGLSATPGSDGMPGARLTLNVTGSTQTYDLRGENGEDATGVAQNGSAATSCFQPSTFSNLTGAPGGAGGDGASGGRGGDGGSADLFIPSLTKLGLLKNLTILNSGGAPGVDSPYIGEGGPGCACTSTSWELPDPNTGVIYYFNCTGGDHGLRGSFSSRSEPGHFGWVTIYVGLNSTTKLTPKFNSTLSTVMGHSYGLNGVHLERKTGLNSILSQGSKTSDEYQLGTYLERKVKFEWKAKISIEEAKMQNATVDASLIGPADQAKVKVTLPTNLRKQIVETPDATVVTVTHVLNSSDPVKIAACAKHDKKGTNICEFSGACFYEAGFCLPK